MKDADKTDVRSFRVAIHRIDGLNVLDNQLWPNGILVRLWKFKSSNKTNDINP